MAALNGERVRISLRLHNAPGNVNTNNGRIAVPSLGLSNTTQEWASG